MKRSLTKEEMLRNKRDIAQLFARSRSNCEAGYFGFCGTVKGLGVKLSFVAKAERVSSAAKCSSAVDQLLVSPAKSLGSAVQRNRAKRLQREFYRHHKGHLRAISQRAALKASYALEGCSVSPDSNLSSLVLAWAQQIVYHWGIVIYVPAGQVGFARPAPNSGIHFWPEARNPLFIAEWRRYQTLLHNLEKQLFRQWRQFLHQQLVL